MAEPAYTFKPARIFRLSANSHGPAAFRTRKRTFNLPANSNGPAAFRTRNRVRRLDSNSAD